MSSGEEDTVEMEGDEEEVEDAPSEGEEPVEQDVPEVCSECEDEVDEVNEVNEVDDDSDSESTVITVTLSKNYTCSVCDRKMYLPCLKLCWACGEDNDFCQDCVKARMFWCTHCNKYNGTSTNRKRKLIAEEEEEE
jgi:hypothetical protein